MSAYVFLITPQFGEPVTATIAEEWDRPNALILANGDSLSRKMIRLHIESSGLTPFGKAVGAEFLAPMDLHYTFATTEKFTLEPVVGEWLDYPENDTAPTLGKSLHSKLDDTHLIPKNSEASPPTSMGLISTSDGSSILN